MHDAHVTIVYLLSSCDKKKQHSKRLKEKAEHGHRIIAHDMLI